MLFGRVNALDRGFRFYEIHAYVRPYERTIQYSQAGNSLNQLVSPEIGGGLNFITDTRKRFQVLAYFNGNTGLKGEFPRFTLGLNPSWVATPKFQLRGQVSVDQLFGNLTLLTIDGGRWIFERSNFTLARGSLGIAWIPTSQLELVAGIGLVEERQARREPVELLDGGALEPTSWPLPIEYNQRLPSADLSATCFFFSHQPTAVSGELYF